MTIRKSPNNPLPAPFIASIAAGLVLGIALGTTLTSYAMNPDANFASERQDRAPASDGNVTIAGVLEKNGDTVTLRQNGTGKVYKIINAETLADGTQPMVVEGMLTAPNTISAQNVHKN